MFVVDAAHDAIEFFKKIVSSFFQLNFFNKITKPHRKDILKKPFSQF